MKKTLLLIFVASFCTMFSFAQIAINQSNMPYIGLVAIENVDTVFSGITPGNSGVSQAWNFSTLQTHTIDTTLFVDPANLTGFSNFPSANIGATTSDGQSFFVDGNSSQFDILGIHGDLGGFAGIVTVKLVPYKRLISFPATFGSSFSGSYSYEITIPFNSPPMDSARISATVDYVYNVDGWGTITTPSFSNIPCLRQVVREINTSYMEVHVPVLGWQPYGSPAKDTTDTYSWWSDTYNYSMAEIETNASGVVSASKYLGASYNLINESSDFSEEMNVFPNPSSKLLHFSRFEMENNIYIYSLDGKIVSMYNMNSGKNQIDISELENGLYFYKRLDTNGQIIQAGKFEISK